MSQLHLVATSRLCCGITRNRSVCCQLERKPRIGLDGGWQPTEQDGEDQRLGADINFEDVDFKFEGMRNNLLKGVSFNIKAGCFFSLKAVRSKLCRFRIVCWDLWGEGRREDHTVQADYATL